jgi:hypothetical protein
VRVTQRLIVVHGGTNRSNSQLRVQVADFGLSRIFNPILDKFHPGMSDQSLEYRRLSSCGTLRYLPPPDDAVLHEGETPNERWQRCADDIYSYGFLLYEVLHGAMACAHDIAIRTYSTQWDESVWPCKNPPTLTLAAQVAFRL